MAKVLKGAAGSLTGRIEKGYLLIKRPVTLPEEPTATVMPQASSKTGGKLDSMKQALSSAKQAAEKKLDAAANALKGVSMQVLKASDGYVPIQLQYNPSSIQLHTMKGEILNRSPGGSSENMFQQWTVPVQSTMSVELIFDDMNVMDAFNLENIVSVSGVRDLGKQLYTSRGASEGFTVRPLVEAIVGAMAAAESRQVIFVWNRMAFDGALVGVNTAYTMFNRKGEPIRARVGIQIFQQNVSKKQEGETQIEVKHNIEYWEKAYDNLFTSNYLGGGSNALEHINKASNLINL